MCIRDSPTRAYFGEKDFQQLAIIREMVKQIGFNGLEIVGCPIVREEDGLEMCIRDSGCSMSRHAGQKTR